MLWQSGDVAIAAGDFGMINHVERAFRAWPVLIRTAQDDETITYGNLAKFLGIHHRAVRYVLGVIQDYCLNEKLPPLTILVVNQGEGMPGPGFIAWDVEDLEAGMEQVFKYNWAVRENPFSYAADGSTEDDLAEEIVNTPNQAADVYARVKVRGTAQSVFRKALLRVYNHQCALCGLSFDEALEAAHLIPWSDADSHQRMSPTNGILLCVVHHRMFDCALITISSTYVITYRDPAGRSGPYSSADIAMTIDLHGGGAHMPAKSKHRPSLKALAHHHKRLGWEL